MWFWISSQEKLFFFSSWFLFVCAFLFFSLNAYSISKPFAIPNRYPFLRCPRKEPNCLFSHSQYPWPFYSKCFFFLEANFITKPNITTHNNATSNQKKKKKSATFLFFLSYPCSLIDFVLSSYLLFFFSCLSAFLFVTVLRLLWRQADTKFSSAALLYRHTAFCGFVVLPEKGRFLKYLLLYFFFLFFFMFVSSVKTAEYPFYFFSHFQGFPWKSFFFFWQRIFLCLFVCWRRLRFFDSALLSPRLCPTAGESLLKRWG